MNRAELPRITQALITAAAVFIIIAGIKMAAPVVVPFLLSIFIAIITAPLVKRLMRWRVPQFLAILLIVTLLLLFGFWLSSLIASSISEFKSQLPNYKQSIMQQFAWVVTLLAKYNIVLSADLINEYLNPSKALGVATDLLAGLGNVMANLFLIILTVIFMLAESSVIGQKFHLALKDPQMKLTQIDEFLDSVNRYMSIKTIISAMTGILISLGLWLIGVDYPLLWGVMAFLLNYIPNIGSLIAALPAILLAAIQLGFAQAGLVALLFLMVNTIMGNVIEPRFMGRGLGLSTLVVFLSLIFWGWLLGSVGMLLSVPLTIVVKIALESSPNSKHIAKLLSD